MPRVTQSRCSAPHLGDQHPRETAAIELREQAVLENHGGVQHPGHRRHGRADLLEQSRHRPRIANVARAGADLDAGPLEVGDGAFRLLGCGPLTADQRKVARASRHQPFRGFQAETAECPGNDVSACGIDRERRIGCADRIEAGRMHDDLADVTGMLHQVQSLPDIVGAKDAVRQRRQCPCLKSCISSM